VQDDTPHLTHLVWLRMTSVLLDIDQFANARFPEDVVTRLDAFLKSEP